MAAVGGLSNSTSSSLSGYGASIKGYGGLASGLDTDSLIEGMTLGTRTKIDELLKKKTTNQWQTDAYRSVSDKLVDIQNKYLDTLNPSSLYRASFFDKSLVTMNGANSEYLSVSGASKSLDTLKVLGVGQLAKDTNLITKDSASIQKLVTGGVDLTKSETVSNLDGERLQFTYGTQNYTLSLHSGQKITTTVNGAEQTFTTDFTTVDKAIESINQMLKDTSLVGVDGTLGDKIVLEKAADSDTLIFKLKNSNETNTVELAGGSEKALKILGFSEDSAITSGGLSGSSAVQINGENGLTSEKHVYELMAGKSITFDFNGTSKEIKLPDEDTVKNWTDDDLKDHLQTELNRAFGTGKITVGIQAITGGGEQSLTFETIDSSSILKIKAAGDGLMGESGVLGINYSTTNRLNLEASLEKSGLKGLASLDGTNGTDIFGEKDSANAGKYKDNAYHDADGNLKLKINGQTIEGLTVNSSIRDIMMAVNSSDAGVKMNYLETSDRFTLTATNHGAAGDINLENDFAEALFGAAGYVKNQGQDAVMMVEYEGGVKGTITRDTNTFNLEGSTFTLKGEFGLEKNSTSGEYQEIDKTGKSRVSFTTSVDADKIAKAVSSLVEDYNTIIKEVYEQVSTKPNRNYGPLTEAEKGDLSETEIKNWETEAKKGILFNDSLLRSLSDKLRTVFTGAADAGTLKKMGLTVSSSYKDSGKIFFDEETFKAALMEDSEKIKNIFTRPSVTDADGNVTDRGGISVRLKAITYQFANTVGTHGSLVKKAGSAYSPLSETDNSLKKIRDQIDDQIDELKVKLQTEIDRYSRQFTQLEQLIAQMNSQSSWLMQATGGM